MPIPIKQSSLTPANCLDANVPPRMPHHAIKFFAQSSMGLVPGLNLAELLYKGRTSAAGYVQGSFEIAFPTGAPKCINVHLSWPDYSVDVNIPVISIGSDGQPTNKMNVAIDVASAIQVYFQTLAASRCPPSSQWRVATSNFMDGVGLHEVRLLGLVNVCGNTWQLQMTLNRDGR